MDLFMPLQDGITATRAIREEAALHDVPIVALSAYGTLGILHHDALAAGCNEYVSKPLDFEQLGYLVDRLLKRAEGEQGGRTEVTSEEVHRTVRFILEQQTQFAAHHQSLQEAQARTEATLDALAQKIDALATIHESRLSRLEESFQLLVRLAERTDKTP
jgi:CheY-like chemotaxis protein